MKLPKSLIAFQLGCLLFPSLIMAQKTASLKGTVVDAKGEAVPGITIIRKDKELGTITDGTGAFYITEVLPGVSTWVVSGVGYEPQEKELHLKAGKAFVWDVTLKESVTEMDEVTVMSQSYAERKQLGGIAVKVIDTRQLQNLTADINQVIRMTPGVVIRESGGVGSGFSLSLNGLSGDQVRYFIDGVPMENFGSALTLNNYPVNLIKRIDVYKGVVPIHLGADALGGAINIITGYQRENFLDATYSFGSFNTHRASVNTQYTDQEAGYYVKFSSFFNHSDNNYWMDEVPLTDELGNIVNDRFRTRRFHDGYTSGMLAGTFGIFDKKIADEWKVTLTYAGNRNNYQHPDFNIKRIFGKFHTENETVLASTSYQKRIGGLSIRAYAAYGNIEESSVDTSTFRYNWAGEAINRFDSDPSDPKGEIRDRRSLFILNDHTFRSQLHLKYVFHPRHSVHVSLSQNHLKRSGEDLVDSLNRSFISSNFINKTLSGLSYQYDSEDERIQWTVFGKGYGYNGKIITQDLDNADQETNTSLNTIGYGTALAYRFAEGAYGVKASFERAYRIPEPGEILGSGLYVLPNPDLQPEKSYNVNLGAWLRKSISTIEINSEINLFLRKADDFIRFPSAGAPFGSFENLDNVRSQGVEGSVSVTKKDHWLFNVNATYQHITDRTPFDEGLENVNYKSRLPNIPYLFGNARLGLSPFDLPERRNVTFYLSTNYVHEFFLLWENNGDPDQKNSIPEQLTLDFSAEMSWKDGRYNVSATSSNLTDAQVFDNFLIQKPGRAFYLKLRYFLNY